jgi:hypothetical protein
MALILFFHSYYERHFRNSLYDGDSTVVCEVIRPERRNLYSLYVLFFDSCLDYVGIFAAVVYCWSPTPMLTRDRCSSPGQCMSFIKLTCDTTNNV